jgi:hypothetical protein
LAMLRGRLAREIMAAELNNKTTPRQTAKAA